MDIDPCGKAAILSGGSKGIGPAIVEVLAECGASVGIAARGQADRDTAVADMNGSVAQIQRETPLVNPA